MAFFRNVIGRLTGSPAAQATPTAARAASAAVASAEWKSRGNAALGKWDLDEAAHCYRQAVAADPADALARLNLGFVMVEKGDAPVALELLTQALALRRHEDDIAHDAHYMLGRAYRQQGHAEKAIASFEAALQERPDFTEAIEELAQLLLGLGRYSQALIWARRLLAHSLSASSLLLCAQALYGLERHTEALEALDAVLVQQPDHVAALEGRGNVLLELGRAEESLTAFQRAMSVQAATADTLSNASAALQKLGRFDQALQWLDQALLLQPEHRNALYNKGHVLCEVLRVEEALEVARRATEIYPEDADLIWNRAVAHLLLGQFGQGWTSFESRWNAPSLGRKYSLPEFDRPRWSGRESLQDKSILLFSEQGYGDSIQFLRYVPLVAARARRVLLKVQPGLVALAAGLAPNCQVLKPGEPATEFDYQCPLLSLPLAFGTTSDRVPCDVPYIRADDPRVRAFRQRLDTQAGAALHVGVAWSGNAHHRNDRNRSMPLGMLHSLAALDCRFVSLQPEVRESDKDAFTSWPQLLRWGEESRDFVDTAALICALDLVITVDTSVAHLAGALGRQVWILLPHCPDWRWMLEREDSPWYPTARLYRQSSAGDWPSVLARVRADLAALSATAPAST